MRIEWRIDHKRKCSTSLHVGMLAKYFETFSSSYFHLFSLGVNRTWFYSRIAAFYDEFPIFNGVATFMSPYSRL